MKITIIAFLVSTIIGCNFSQKESKTFFFVPNNYTGWVNIVFEDSSSKSISLDLDNNFVFLINKNPEEFSVNAKALPDGRYIDSYYYYDIDTSYRLRELDYPRNNVFFSRFITFQKKNSHGIIENKTAYSFYVSSIPLNIDSISIDKLPQNRLLKKQ